MKFKLIIIYKILPLIRKVNQEIVNFSYLKNRAECTALPGLFFLQMNSSVIILQNAHHNGIMVLVIVK